MDFDAVFSTNPPHMPITALRDRTITPLEVVQLAAASARADAFTYGEPFDLLAAELDRVAEKIRGTASAEYTFRSLSAIIADDAWRNESRATECLAALDHLPADDLARDDFRAAAQTFALLAIVDRIGYSGAGYNLVQAVCAAGGVQP